MPIGDGLPRTGPARRIAASALLAGLLALAPSVAGAARPDPGGGTQPPAAGEGPGRPDPGETVPDEDPPNIVVIMSDDQSMAEFNPEAMPRTFTKIVERGTLFDDFVVTTPMCCPSRAAFLTGQYGHNNGVLTNWPGYPDLRRAGAVLPTWLRQSGYRTGFFGKWLHGYDEVADSATDPAPGWSRWVRLMVPGRYQRYELSMDGERTSYGRAPGSYLTTQLNHHATEWIDEHAGGSKPLFLWLAHLAPHSAKQPLSACDRSAIPAPGDEALFADASLPRPANFDEADIADKPAFLQRLSPLSETELAELERVYRCRSASLAAVDRGVEEIVEAFGQAGEIGRTVFIYTGDNGYFLGEHRLRRGKGLPYEEAISQPLAIRAPRRYRSPGPRVPLAEGTAAGIDLAPTILELAGGVRPCRRNGSCRTLDGRSLVPLLNREGEWPTDRAVAVEMSNPVRGSGRRGEAGSCEYSALRSASTLYVEHVRTFDPEEGRCVQELEVERYDLRLDPFQLANLHPPGTLDGVTEEANLSLRLRSLERCAGTPEQRVSGSPPCE